MGMSSMLRPMFCMIALTVGLGYALLGVPPVFAELVCDGHPMPYGKICCSGGRYCEPGTMCIDGGIHCLPLSSPRACFDGTYCDAGSVCTPDGRCISASSERYCGGREFCNQGFACIGGNKCLPVTSERYCGNGHYCDEGTYCTGDGHCRSHADDDLLRRSVEEMRRSLEEAARRQELQQEAEERSRQEYERAGEASKASGSASCSTITDKDHPSTGHCEDAKRTLDAAHADRHTRPAHSVAQLRKAAQEFGIAGDLIQQAAALKEAAELDAEVPDVKLESPPSLTGHEHTRSDCDDAIIPQLRAIRKRIEQLSTEEPDPKGGAVEEDSCSSRLHKLFGHGFGELDVIPYANQVAIRAEWGCLQLKQEYLQQACKCTKRGLTFSEDEAIQDQTLEAYSAVKRLEEKARSKGIQNKVINAWVKKAGEVRDCYNLQTIEILRRTEHALERELALSPDSAPPQIDHGPLAIDPGRSANECGWFAIIYCSQDEQAARSVSVREGTRTIDTSSPAFPNFRKGWFCSAYGPMQKGDAQARAGRARASFPTAYIKNSCS